MEKYFLLLKLALKNINRRKIRSFLTVLGVIIGVFSIAVFVSLGKGIETALVQTFEKLGKDKIIVLPGVQSRGSFATAFIGSGFDFKLANEIERLPDVKIAIPGQMITSYVSYKKETAGLNVYGYPLKDYKYFSEIGYQLEKGRVPSNNKECVIGHGTAYSAFKETVRLGDKIEIGGKFKCKVVGILQSLGSQHEDFSVFITSEAMKTYFNKDKADFIVVIAKNVEKAKEEIKKFLERKLGRNSFSVLTMEQIVSQFQSLLNLLSFAVAGIAGISLITAAVGIMNTMYMAVTERVEEIGIMKAIGAKVEEILFIFLVEAGLLGLLGGITGLALATIVIFAFGAIAKRIGMNFVPVIDLKLYAFLVIFSFAVGVLSGILPARAAAKTDPIKALRRV